MGSWTWVPAPGAGWASGSASSTPKTTRCAWTRGALPCLGPCACSLLVAATARSGAVRGDPAAGVFFVAAVLTFFTVMRLRGLTSPRLTA